MRCHGLRERDHSCGPGVSELGSPDILVNNAGIDVVRMFVDTDESLWRRLTDVNYIGFLAVTHATVPHMIAKKSGLIIT